MQVRAECWHPSPVFRALAAAGGGRPAVVQDQDIVTWDQLDRRASALAADLLAAGVSHQGKVATFLYNCPEYMQTYLAAFAAGVVPVNCNFRYGAEELHYLLENADAEAVVFHTSLVDVVGAVRGRLPLVRRWYAVSDAGPVPQWAVELGTLHPPAAQPRPAVPWSGDDLLLLYTGGTTGLPKGVMWRLDDLVQVLGRGGNRLLGIAPAASPRALLERARGGTPGPVVLVASPLMHGTGQFSALSTLLMGGTVVLLADRHLDVASLWAEAARHRADSIIVVGQTFGDPMLEHLRAHRSELDLDALRLITSSGVMWSQENKAGFLELLPGVTLFDNYGSSEAVGVGASISSARDTSTTGVFRLGRNSAVFTEDGRRVEPGSGERGMVAITGRIPVGYYKDEVKTRDTFRVFEGRRWSVPGDWAEIEPDGAVRLLGRGSSCINTGGEKVFPEEVEEVLKRHPSVRDAAVVGVPDSRFGEVVCAIVEPPTGAHADANDADALRAWTRRELASFKVPRHVVFVSTIGRAANGKLDHRFLKQLAAERTARQGG